MLQTGLGSGGGGGVEAALAARTSSHPPCSLSGFSRRILGPLTLATSICQCEGHWLAWGRQRGRNHSGFHPGAFSCLLCGLFCNLRSICHGNYYYFLQ